MVFLEHKELGRLVERSRSGDERAFQKLYEHTARIQYHQICQLVPDSGEAQDALQDTYLLLYQNLDKINPPDCLVAYLNRLTYYVAKNAQKRSNRFHNRMINIEELSEMKEEEASLKQVELHEDSKIIRNMIEELPEQERLLLIMRYYQKQTLQQAAFAMGISLTTAKRIHRSAKAHLKLRLQRKGYHSAWAMAIFPAFRFIKSELDHSPLPALDGKTKIIPSSSVPDQIVKAQPPSTLAAGAAAVTAAKTAALAAAAGVGIVSVVSHAARPVIGEVHMPASYVSSPAIITAAAKGTLPIKEARIRSASGQTATGILEKDGTIRFQVTDNGSYTLTITTADGREAAKTVSVSCIDKKSPAVQSVRREGDSMKIIFNDEESGIDPASLYCETADGLVTLYDSYDKKTQTAIFTLPEDNNVLHFSDKAGNRVKADLLYFPGIP